MKNLRRDPFSRLERPVQLHGRSRWAGASLVGALFVAVSLLTISRLDHPWLRTFRTETAQGLAPALNAASVPTTAISQLRQQVSDYMNLFVEIDRLKFENQQLKQYVWRAEVLEAEAAQYRALLKAVKEPGLDFVTGRVIIDSRGIFARSVLVNAGRGQGVRNGYAVVNSEGLVGRVVDASASVARVLLITDLNSRIPVLVGQGGERAVLHGDNSPNPALEHLRSDPVIADGDPVFTSGQDGVLPKGLRIGTVVKSGRTFMVRTHASLDALDYVSVLLFQGPILDLLEPPALVSVGKSEKSNTNILATRTVRKE